MLCEWRLELWNIDKYPLRGKQFPKWNLRYRNQLNEGLKMKQDDESIVNSPLNGKNAEEILDHFKGYKFADDHGHRLELCQDFIELVKLAAQAKAE